ncbi:MAG: hypothetical protein QOJ63_824 [Solirubrobacteraceae bacterium]|nr:hypothetical protein [Solirubrobacteraceae bacterium]
MPLGALRADSLEADAAYAIRLAVRMPRVRAARRRRGTGDRVLFGPPRRMVSEPAPGRWRGPLRAAVAVFVVGALAVWLVKPIGNPCPDLSRLPQGSTAHSAPSFSPPGTRTCTYTAAGGTRAQARYVPWLDWIVLALLAALVAAAVSLASPDPRRARTQRPPRPERDGRPSRPAPAPRAPRAQGVRGVSQRGTPKPHAPPEPEDRPRRGGGAERPSRSAPERDPAERERARRERAERDRSRRDR